VNHRGLIQSVICMARVLIQSATARVIALPVDEHDAAAHRAPAVFEGMVEGNRPSIAH